MKVTNFQFVNNYDFTTTGEFTKHAISFTSLGTAAVSINYDTHKEIQHPNYTPKNNEEMCFTININI